MTHQRLRHKWSGSNPSGIGPINSVRIIRCARCTRPSCCTTPYPLDLAAIHGQHAVLYPAAIGGPIFAATFSGNNPNQGNGACNAGAAPLISPRVSRASRPSLQLGRRAPPSVVPRVSPGDTANNRASRYAGSPGACSPSFSRRPPAPRAQPVPDHGRRDHPAAADAADEGHLRLLPAGGGFTTICCLEDFFADGPPFSSRAFA